MSGDREQPHAPDYGLIIITLALLCIGIVMVYSASLVASYAEHGNQTYFFQRQLLWCAVGVVTMFLFMRIPYYLWQRISLLAMVVSVGLLVAVLIPGIGSTVLGATRWVRIGEVGLQPSELCKVTLAIYMAAWLSKKGERVREFGYGLVPFVVILALIVALIMKQPDMGTALVIIGTAVTIFFVSGANLLQLIPVGLVGAGGMAMLAFNSSYRHGRLTAFMDPWAYSEDSGYHVVQSLIALGSGGIQGLGLGDSRQKFPGLLPFPYTDSIYAVIGEELGLVGCTVVLALFLLLAYRGLRTAWRARDGFGSLLAIGISCQMVLQAFLNIAVVTSTVPFTGITLPFVSYGGSSMLVSFAAMGILLNVTKYTKEHANDEVTVTAPALAAERGRHWWARVPHARRGASSPQPAFARG